MTTGIFKFLFLFPTRVQLKAVLFLYNFRIDKMKNINTQITGKYFIIYVLITLVRLAAASIGGILYLFSEYSSNFLPLYNILTHIFRYCTFKGRLYIKRRGIGYEIVEMDCDNNITSIYYNYVIDIKYWLSYIIQPSTHIRRWEPTIILSRSIQVSGIE